MSSIWPKICMFIRIRLQFVQPCNQTPNVPAPFSEKFHMHDLDVSTFFHITRTMYIPTSKMWGVGGRSTTLSFTNKLTISIQNKEIWNFITLFLLSDLVRYCFASKCFRSNSISSMCHCYLADFYIDQNRFYYVNWVKKFKERKR